MEKKEWKNGDIFYTKENAENFLSVLFWNFEGALQISGNAGISTKNDNFQFFWGLSCDSGSSEAEENTFYASTTSTSTTTTTSTSTTTSIDDCIVNNPLTQYCYTLSEKYESSLGYLYWILQCWRRF